MSITKTNFCFQIRQLLIKWTLQIKRRKISRCKKNFLIKMIRFKAKWITLSPLPISFCVIRCYQVIKKWKWFRDVVPGQNEIQTMHYCFKERASILEHVQWNVGIFQTSCKWSTYSSLILVAYWKKRELHFVVVLLYLMFIYYHKWLSS